MEREASRAMMAFVWALFWTAVVMYLLFQVFRLLGRMVRALLMKGFEIDDRLAYRRFERQIGRR